MTVETEKAEETSEGRTITVNYAKHGGGNEHPTLPVGASLRDLLVKQGELEPKLPAPPRPKYSRKDLDGMSKEELRKVGAELELRLGKKLSKEKMIQAVLGALPKPPKPAPDKVAGYRVIHNGEYADENLSAELHEGDTVVLIAGVKGG